MHQGLGWVWKALPLQQKLRKLQTAQSKMQDMSALELRMMKCRAVKQKGGLMTVLT